MPFSAAAPAGVPEERAQHPGGPCYSLLLAAVDRCIDASAPVPAGRSSWFLALQILICGHGRVDLRFGQRFALPWPPPGAVLDALLCDIGLSGPARVSPDTAGSSGPRKRRRKPGARREG